MDTKIIKHIKNVLNKFGSKYLVNNALKKDIIIKDLNDYDDALIGDLLKDNLIHKLYTKKINGIEIFELNEFISMFEFKEYWENSYTKYSNKIGLTSDNKFINDSYDVVLDFPYKDTILKAGMKKDELNSNVNNNEPFLNEILAKEEINELLEPKIMVNSKYYDKNGEKQTSFIKEDDNLIIKGNNLVAISSIQEKYAGKVKMIYLDPPYNTGSDSFEYNDSFSRSTWLTFIKNRVEKAKPLLADDGVLLIQTSFHQFPYLRVLLDNIMGEDNHIFDMNILVRHPERSLASDKKFNDVMEYTLIYSKNSDYEMPKNTIKKTPDKYDYVVETSNKPDKIIHLGTKDVEIYFPEHTHIKKVLPDKNNLHRETIRGSIREKNSSGRFYVSYIEKLREKYPYRTIFKVPDMGDDGIGYRYFELPKNSKIKNGAYYQGMPRSTNVTKKPYPNYIDLVNEYNHSNDEGVYSFRNGKKPEFLIEKYLNMFTKPGDLVMDFFMGSGTTQAVSMKLNRQFIGIEQMDYINSISVNRLKKVIDGEKGGISLENDWNGGSSFVYTELMQKNVYFIKCIENSRSIKELMQIYSNMKNESDLDFRLDLEEFEEEQINLSLKDKKKLLIKMIDKNQLYYNLGNIDDVNVRNLLTDNDYDFNKNFYRKG